MKFNEQARRRAVEKMGVPVTVYNWTWDGTTDDYGDPAAGSFTESTESSSGVFLMAERAEQVGDVDGPNITEIVRIYLPDDVSIHIASEADETKATEIEVDEDGRTYKVYDKKPGYRGITMTMCRRAE